MMDQRTSSAVYIKVLSENFPQSVSPRKEMGDRTRQRKQFLTSAGLEPTTSGFDRPLLYRMSYETRREQVVDLLQRLALITITKIAVGCFMLYHTK